MAYVQGQQTEEEKKREEQMRGASGAAGGPPASLPSGAQPSPTSGASGNFTNLQRYLEENRSQAGDLAGKVAGTVTAAGEEAKTAAEGLAAAGKTQIEAARVQPSGVLEEAAVNPMAVAGDPAKKAAFTRERDASYAGPAGLEDVEGYQTAQDKVRKAQERIGLTETETGRTALLEEMGGPGYGRGKATLNQLLLSGDPDAARTVAAAGEPYKGLRDYLGAQTEEARTAAQKAAEEANATKEAVQTRFTGPDGLIPSFGSGLDARVAAARTGAGEQFDAAANKIMSGEQLTDQEIALLGVTREEVSEIQAISGALKQDFNDPIPAQDFFQSTSSPDLITRENFATDDDYAEALALADLMGGSHPGLLTQETRGQAGTAITDLGDLRGGDLLAKQRDFLATPFRVGAQDPEVNKILSGYGVNSWDSLLSKDPMTAFRTLAGINYAVNIPAGKISAGAKQALLPFIQSGFYKTMFKALMDAVGPTGGNTQGKALDYLPDSIKAMFPGPRANPK